MGQRLDGMAKSSIVSKKRIGMAVPDAGSQAHHHTSSGSYLETKDAFQS